MAKHNKPKPKTMCISLGCQRIADAARNFCTLHYHQFTKAHGSMTRAERDVVVKRIQSRPSLPRWEFEPTPQQTAELIARAEQRAEQEKADVI